MTKIKSNIIVSLLMLKINKSKPDSIRFVNSNFKTIN